ncbi:MAG: IMP dehydrogenase [Candidatus Sericytochromatia bacterium]|nr:IMP dehydrogenase [Candidatus Sericytochromatia bacterium]
MREGLTFDDVLLQPRFSSIISRKEVNTKTRLTKNITINVPIVSANMDTVTESGMAICMAELGGMGIIHRFLTVEQQINEVIKVKRAHNFIIHDPYTIDISQNIGDVKLSMRNKGIHSLLVVDSQKRLKGIVTTRDLLFEDDDNVALETIMTSLEKLICKKVNHYSEVDFEDAKKILKTNKLEKLPLIDEQGMIKGLITVKDIEKRLEFPNAVKDNNGRLMVGAAIGVKNDYLERTAELVRVGVDVLVIDIAHGHSQSLLDTLYKIKSEFPHVDVIAGNVATKHGTLDLISAGADAIKCGVGPGGTCITRLVTGSGVPQLTAIMDCCETATYKDIPVIADGGIKYSGDIVKALAAGASSVMLGSLFAGCEESPGHTRIKDGQKFKVYRGMASYDAAASRTNTEKGYEINMTDYVPEGVETTIPYKGKVKEVMDQLVGGIRSGMSYLGVNEIEDMTKNADFIKMTAAGWHESKPHAQK